MDLNKFKQLDFFNKKNQWKELKAIYWWNINNPKWKYIGKKDTISQDFVENLEYFNNIYPEKFSIFKKWSVETAV